MTTNTPNYLLIDWLELNDQRLLAVLTLNRPKALNALNEPLVSELHQALDMIKQRDEVVAVVLNGAGERGFCAGGDIKAMHASVQDMDNACVRADAFFEAEYRLDYAIHTYPKPIVVWGHGIVMGGGLGLFQGAQYRVLEVTAKVAMPEVSIGLFPDVAASHLFHQLPEPWGRFFALTGAAMNASEALELGVADYQATEGSLSVFLDLLTGEGLLDVNPIAPRIERALTMMSDAVVDESIPASRLSSVVQQIEHIFGETTLEEAENRARALFNKDIPAFLEAALSNMLSGSAVSLCCSDLALKATRDMTLAEVFKFDLMLVSHMIRCPDFSEGVRAMLIDKDKQPRWTYSDVRAVPDALLASVQEPLWPEHPLADMK